MNNLQYTIDACFDTALLLDSTMRVEHINTIGLQKLGLYDQNYNKGKFSKLFSLTNNNSEEEFKRLFALCKSSGPQNIEVECNGQSYLARIIYLPPFLVGEKRGNFICYIKSKILQDLSSDMSHKHNPAEDITIADNIANIEATVKNCARFHDSNYCALYILEDSYLKSVCNWHCKHITSTLKLDEFPKTIKKLTDRRELIVEDINEVSVELQTELRKIAIEKTQALHIKGIINDNKLVAILVIGYKNKKIEEVPGSKLFLDSICRLLQTLINCRYSLLTVSKSEALFRTIFELAEDAIFISNQRQEYIYINSAMARLCGKDAKKIIGKSDNSLSFLYGECTRAEIEARVLNGETIHTEIRIDLNHHHHYYHIVNAPVVDTELQKIIGVYGIARDITALKMSESSLRDSDKRFRSLFDNTQVSLWLQDYSAVKKVLEEAKEAGVEDLYAYLHENPKIVKHCISVVDNIHLNLTTVKLFKAINIKHFLENVHKIFPPSFSKMFLNQILCCASGQTSSPQPLEMTVHTLDNKECHIMLNWTILPGHEKTWARVLLTIVDISKQKIAEQKRKSLEDKMLQAQKLESLGLLAGGIAHDFNNLLAAILGNTEFILSECPPNLPIRDGLNDIQTAAKRAALLSKQMLAYSGKGHFIVRPTNLNEVINGMIPLLKTSISKKVKLKINFSKNLPVIDADIAQIRQVVITLVTNASEAMKEKSGVVKITTHTEFCSRELLDKTFFKEQQTEGYYVVLEVSDNGCGISEEDKTKIFDPFFSSKFTGRGLGLAAVLGIIRGHSGAIKVDSKVGEGSVFSMLFPCSPHQTTPQARALRFPVKDKESISDKAWRGTGTILVVDDESIVCDVASRSLKKLGFHTLTACDGLEAIKVFKKHSQEITAVLLDLNMPNLNGQETFIELRKIQPNARVVLSSGYDKEDVSVNFKNMELLAGFLQKPYRISELRKIFRTICDSQ